MERDIATGKELGLVGLELKEFCENERKLELEAKSREREERIQLRQLEVEKLNIEAAEQKALREEQLAIREIEEQKAIREIAEQKAVRELAEQKAFRDERLAIREADAVERAAVRDAEKQIILKKLRMVSDRLKFDFEREDRERQHVLAMRRTEVPEPSVVSRGEGNVRPPRDDTLFWVIIFLCLG